MDSLKSSASISKCRALPPGRRQLARQFARQLGSLIPASFKKTPGYAKVSLWHATIKYIDHLKTTSTTTAFEADPHNAISFSDKNRACRDLLARRLPQKYHVGSGSMSVLVPNWSVRYVQDLTAMTFRSKTKQISRPKTGVVREWVVTLAAATAVPVDEDGVLDAVSQLQELLSTDDEDAGQLIALAEDKMQDWVRARDSIKDFVSIGNVHFDSLLVSLAGLRSDLTEGLQASPKLNAEGLLKLVWTVDKKIGKLYGAQRKLSAWFEVGSRPDAEVE